MSFKWVLTDSTSDTFSLFLFSLSLLSLSWYLAARITFHRDVLAQELNKIQLTITTIKYLQTFHVIYSTLHVICSTILHYNQNHF